MFMYKMLLLTAMLAFSACADDLPVDLSTPAAGENTGQTTRPAGIRLAEKGHRKAAFLKKSTYAFDIVWSHRNGLGAHLVQRPDGSAIYIRYGSGTQAWWNGKDVKLLAAPGDTIGAEQARFDLRAWHYWSCLPYKLDNPGAHWQTMPDRLLGDQRCSVGRLQFDPGTGDSPDDWFAVFIGQTDRLLLGAAFVSTQGKNSAERAAKKPQMIRYSDFRLVDGIPVAQRWTFSAWNTEELDSRANQGAAILSNIRFDRETDVFSKE